MFRHHFATFGNTIEMCKIIKVIIIYLILNIFQKVRIVILRWNILRYLTKMLRHFFNCNEILEIFPICFCNILCYEGLVIWISSGTLVIFATVVYVITRRVGKCDWLTIAIILTSWTSMLFSYLCYIQLKTKPVAVAKTATQIQQTLHY